VSIITIITLLICVRFAVSFVIQLFVSMKSKYLYLVHFDQCLVTRQILTRSFKLLHFLGFFVLFLFGYLVFKQFFYFSFCKLIVFGIK